MKPLSEEEIAEGWIAHDGEGCPVDKTVIVDVKKRGGAECLNFAADVWGWRHVSKTADIVAYRVVNQGEALKAAVHAGVDKMEMPGSLIVISCMNIGDGLISILTNQETYEVNLFPFESRWWIREDGVRTDITGNAKIVDEIKTALIKSKLLEDLMPFELSMYRDPMMEPQPFTSDPLASTYGDDKPTTTEAFFTIDNVETGAVLQGGVVEAGESFFGAEQDKAMGDDKPAKDRQEGGSHYQMPIQPIDFIEKNGIGFSEGNIIKYIVRYKRKGGLKDLRKAQHYLEMLIERMEGEVVE